MENVLVVQGLRFATMKPGGEKKQKKKMKKIVKGAVARKRVRRFSR